MDGIGVADRSLVSEQARIGRVWADVGGVEMGRTLIRSSEQSEHCEPSETQQSKGRERKRSLKLCISSSVRGSDKPVLLGLLPYTLLGYC